MVHEIEYRVYWVVGSFVPLLLALTIFMIPAFQKLPEVRITVTDSLPDHLYKTNEVVTLRYEVKDLNHKGIVATWTFGAEVFAWQSIAPDTCKITLKARPDWSVGDENELGLKLDVAYDTLPPTASFGWVEAITLEDSLVSLKFPQPGRYRIRLQVRDTLYNKSYLTEHQIDIMPSLSESSRDTMVKIIGPSTGLVGEELIFSSTGSKVNFWYWKFGDDNSQDANRPQVVHSYSHEGKYQIKLKTDNPDRWFSHWVEIFPTWNADSLPAAEIDSSGILTKEYELALLKRLQAIANTSPADDEAFYNIKSNIQVNYLSENLSPIPVWINEDKQPIDFDSYCQRIHFLEGRLRIRKVAFEWDGDSTSRRIARLFVQQEKTSN